MNPKQQPTPTQSQDEPLDDKALRAAIETIMFDGAYAQNITMAHHQMDELVALVQAHIDKAVALARVEGAIEEQLSHVLPLVEKAHIYEQSDEGSGIQLFDNDRLARLVELQSQKAALVGEV